MMETFFHKKRRKMFFPSYVFPDNIVVQGVTMSNLRIKCIFKEVNLGEKYLKNISLDAITQFIYE